MGRRRELEGQGEDVAHHPQWSGARFPAPSSPGLSLDPDQSRVPCPHLFILRLPISSDCTSASASHAHGIYQRVNSSPTWEPGSRLSGSPAPQLRQEFWKLPRPTPLLAWPAPHLPWRCGF